MQDRAVTAENINEVPAKRCQLCNSVLVETDEGYENSEGVACCCKCAFSTGTGIGWGEEE